MNTAGRIVVLLLCGLGIWKAGEIVLSLVFRHGFPGQAAGFNVELGIPVLIGLALLLGLGLWKFGSLVLQILH